MSAATQGVQYSSRQTSDFWDPLVRGEEVVISDGRTCGSFFALFSQGPSVYSRRLRLIEASAFNRVKVLSHTKVYSKWFLWSKVAITYWYNKNAALLRGVLTNGNF